MAQIKAVLWDIDNTLLDFEKAQELAVRLCFSRFHLGECTDEMLSRYSAINHGYWEALERGERTKKEILRLRFADFFAEYGLDVSLADEFNEEYQIRLGDYAIFLPHAKDVVKALKGKVWQAAVTNGTKRAQQKKLQTSGLAQLLDGVFISEDVGAEKPSPAFFDAVFKQMPECSKEEILIVGDSLTSDMAGGRQTGIKTCYFHPKEPVKPEDAGTDYVISSLSQVPDIIWRMESVISIRDKFFEVDAGECRTIGGSQEFFEPFSSPEDETKKKMGCGIVSVCDLLLYRGIHRPERILPEGRALQERHKELTRESYKEYYNRIYALAGGVSRRRGINGIRLAGVFNRLAKREGWKERASWNIGYRHFEDKIRRMLECDTPVTLSVPVVFRRKKEGLVFYRMQSGSAGMQMREACRTSAHYVTVLGLVRYREKTYLEITSWGRLYYVDLAEYLAFSKKQFLGFVTGNIMVINLIKS